MPGFQPMLPRFRLENCRLSILLALVALPSLTGCMAWKSENVAPVQALKRPVPPTLRVTMLDGEIRYLDSPRIEGDSLIGNAQATTARWTKDRDGRQVPVAAQPAGRTALALSQVARTDARRVHAGKTAVVAVPTVAVAGLMAVTGARPRGGEPGKRKTTDRAAALLRAPADDRLQHEVIPAAPKPKAPGTPPSPDPAGDQLSLF